MMEGYKENLKEFLEEQEQEENKVIPLSPKERIELKRIEDEIDFPSAS